jgi:hypothetical protein
MRYFAGILGMTVFCAVVLAGCDSVPDMGGGHSERADIQTLAMGQTSSCQFIADVSAASSYGEDQDIQRSATLKIFALAAEKGGNAVLIWSTVARTSSQTNNPATMSMTAKVYACKPRPGLITQ